jgi:ABC-type Fe3+-hydroxamate transport system substrate-binding protein
MSIFTDQLGNTIELNTNPKRIISLVPSQTELLYDLGLDEEVIGITKFCIHPDHWFRNKQRVGGTKNVNIEKVSALQPDLIIANKEENVKEQIEALQQIAPVWVSDVNNLDDALNMICSIGEMAGKTAKAKGIIANIQKEFLQLSTLDYQLSTIHSTLSTAYLIWKDPYMTIGSDTFINDILQRCGFRNIFEKQQRYPEINIEQLQKANCELLLLSSEPYPFDQKHIDEIKQQLPDTKIILVDGEMFSWYGSRLQFAPAYFQKLIQQVTE